MHDRSLSEQAVVTKSASKPQCPFCGDDRGLVEIHQTVGLILPTCTAVCGGSQLSGACEIAIVILCLRFHQVDIVTAAKLEGQACSRADGVGRERLRDGVPIPSSRHADDERHV